MVSLLFFGSADLTYRFVLRDSTNSPRSCERASILAIFRVLEDNCDRFVALLHVLSTNPFPLEAAPQLISFEGFVYLHQEYGDNLRIPSSYIAFTTFNFSSFRLLAIPVWMCTSL